MLPAGDPPLRAPAHLPGEEEGAEGCGIHPAEPPPDSKPRAAGGADRDGDTDRALTGRGGARCC